MNDVDLQAIFKRLARLEHDLDMLKTIETIDDLSAGSTLTISAGVVTISTQATPSTRWRKIATEASAATDDLDTVSGGVAGDVLILSNDGTGDTVVFKDATGNLNLNGVDFTCSTSDGTITILFDGSAWREIARSNNA